MQCYLPHEIEPFYSEPNEFNPNDDWHLIPMTDSGRLDPKEKFDHWRRQYMNWHTDEELRQDAKKFVQSQRASERLIAALGKFQKKKRQKNHVKKHMKCRIKILKRQRTESSSHSSEDVGPATESSSHGWMPSDAASESSSHSWMPSDAASDDAASESSSHSWMPSET